MRSGDLSSDALVPTAFPGSHRVPGRANPCRGRGIQRHRRMVDPGRPLHERDHDHRRGLLGGTAPLRARKDLYHAPPGRRHHRDRRLVRPHHFVHRRVRPKRRQKETQDHAQHRGSERSYRPLWRREDGAAGHRGTHFPGPGLRGHRERSQTHGVDPGAIPRCAHHTGRRDPGREPDGRRDSQGARTAHLFERRHRERVPCACQPDI